MGVYIPSLKMPQTCEDCTLESYCSLWVEARRLCGETFTDAKSRIKATIRHPNCPLVEVKPHGRLIDADAAMRAACEALCHRGVFCPDNRCKEVREVFDAVPTIIEADDSFFNSLKRGLEQAINGDVREITIVEVEGKDGSN